MPKIEVRFDKEARLIFIASHDNHVKAEFIDAEIFEDCIVLNDEIRRLDCSGDRLEHSALVGRLRKELNARVAS